jgi:hypothetical protein
MDPVKAGIFLARLPEPVLAIRDGPQSGTGCLRLAQLDALYGARPPPGRGERGRCRSARGAGIILVHNHPSDDPSLSRADSNDR